MGNRSNIKLVGNTTQGMNVGSGDGCVFKEKVNGNVLQFRTISATGNSVQVIQTDDKILISGGTSGGGIISSANGLTDNGTTVCLGGTLTQNTIFTGGASNYHLQYGGNYGASYTARSIPDVGWVTGNTGGGFLGVVSKASPEPTNLKNNQWVKPAANGTCFNYTFDNFCDSANNPISVNLSLEDVYLRYHQIGDYWSKEYYSKPITSGYTWIGDPTNKVCEVRVIEEWVGSESNIQYTGQKYSYPTQSIFQVDVGSCATVANKIFIRNINLNSVGDTCLFTIPLNKCVMISTAKLIMRNNAPTDTFTVSIGNNYCHIPSCSYNNMICDCQISNLNLGEVYELLPATDLQSKISGYSIGSDVCLRVQAASTGTLSADLLLEGFIY